MQKYFPKNMILVSMCTHQHALGCRDKCWKQYFVTGLRQTSLEKCITFQSLNGPHVHEQLKY